jgi:hypothetical protein
MIHIKYKVERPAQGNNPTADGYTAAGVVMLGPFSGGTPSRDGGREVDEAGPVLIAIGGKFNIQGGA